MCLHGSATTLCPAQCSYAALVTILDNSLINLLFRCVPRSLFITGDQELSSPEFRHGHYRLRRLSESRLRKGCFCTGQPQKENPQAALACWEGCEMIQINRGGDAAVGFPNGPGCPVSLALAALAHHPSGRRGLRAVHCRSVVGLVENACMSHPDTKGDDDQPNEGHRRIDFHPQRDALSFFGHGRVPSGATVGLVGSR